ncbi:MAG: hypothetical protein ACFFD1_10995 [Candidatus Thorarchaeota archaeon]
MPKISIALSLIFQDIEEKAQTYQGDILNDVKDICWGVIKDNQHEQWNIESIITPIIKDFKNFLGVRCLALNLGFRVWSLSYLPNWDDLMDWLQDISVNIVPFINEIYGGYAKIIGVCDDHSYVLASDYEGQIIFGPKCHDTYIWFECTKFGRIIIPKNVGQHALFKIYPKERITLPHSEKEMLQLDTEKFKKK